MFGFHSRSRSLIPVKDLEKIETAQDIKRVLAHEVQEEEPLTSRQRRNLIMIYLIFLAEALMSSSLSSQINILLPSSSACLTMDLSLLRSILQCAYYFGSASGIIFGLAADRLGRRVVAIFGLVGMSCCCISMGFATTFTTFCVLRCLAGAIGAAATVSGLAMLADSTHGSNRRVKIVARLPLVAVCGQLGPLLSNMIRQLAQHHFAGVFKLYPGLAGQIACAALVISITVTEIVILDETLPKTESTDLTEEDDNDCEKAAFLGQHRVSEDSLAISIIDALNDDAAKPTSRISITQMLTAPSISLLVASYSLLSLHSSTFEVILQHIGHTDAANAGMDIPCSWMQPVLLIVRTVAALRVLHSVPKLVSRVGLLPMYRRISVVFPILYVTIPAVALSVHATSTTPLVSGIISIVATLVKTTLANAATVLVLLLVLSMAPDATSTGTLIGIVSVSELFKALAVGLAGASYYLFDNHSMMTVNIVSWSALAVVAVAGGCLTRKLRDTPVLGTDLPSSCFAWQGVFDAESDYETGF